MFNFILGVMLGAVLAPFWISLWAKIETTAAYKKALLFFNKK